MANHGVPTAQTADRAAAQIIKVDGFEIAHRELGGGTATPLVALIHLGANLDAWDPQVVDPLAVDRRVIMLGYRGVGRSTGRVRDSLGDMADDAIAAIRALGLARIDLLGLSMGGMVAQEIIARAPGLVRRVVLASTAPTGGPGLRRMTGVMLRGAARGALTGRPATSLLFFTRSTAGRWSAAAYQARLMRPRADREPAVSPGIIRAQLRAVARRGALPAPTAALQVERALAIHGDADVLVPVTNAGALRAAFPGIEVVIVPDAGHGVVSQIPATLTDRIRAFLRG